MEALLKTLVLNLCWYIKHSPEKSDSTDENEIVYVEREHERARSNYIVKMKCLRKLSVNQIYTK